MDHSVAYHVDLHGCAAGHCLIITRCWIEKNALSSRYIQSTSYPVSLRWTCERDRLRNLWINFKLSAGCISKTGKGIHKHRIQYNVPKAPMCQNVLANLLRAVQEIISRQNVTQDHAMSWNVAASRPFIARCRLLIQPHSVLIGADRP